LLLFFYIFVCFSFAYFRIVGVCCVDFSFVVPKSKCIQYFDQRNLFNLPPFVILIISCMRCIFLQKQHFASYFFLLSFTDIFYKYLRAYWHINWNNCHNIYWSIPLWRILLFTLYMNLKCIEIVAYSSFMFQFINWLL